MKLFIQLYNWTGNLAWTWIGLTVIYYILKWSNITYLAGMLDIITDIVAMIVFFFFFMTTFQHQNVTVDKYKEEEKAKKDQFEFEKKNE